MTEQELLQATIDGLDHFYRQTGNQLIAYAHVINDGNGVTPPWVIPKLRAACLRSDLAYELLEYCRERDEAHDTLTPAIAAA